MNTRFALFSVASMFAVAGTASAQSKFTKLKEEPAIRNKVELRDDRWEIVPEATGSLNSPFRQHVMGRLRFRYHFSDFFAVGFTGFGGTTFPTKSFTGIIQIQDPGADGADLPGGEGDLEGSQDAAFDALRRVRAVNFGASLDGELTPIYGKLGIFGKYFVRYDLSLVLGMGAVQTAGILQEIEPSGDSDGIDARLIPAPHFGVGTRLFVNDFVALNLEFRDTLILDNFDGGLVEDVPDTKLNNFVTGTIGAAIFFPTAAKLSK
jgi:outer membrane beta-barrel protein